MAVKVGEGYIDVETRLDQDNFVKVSEAMGKRASLAFGKNYNENIQKAFRDADRQFDVHINKQMSAFQSLEKQRVKAAEDSTRSIRRLQDEIASSTAADRRMSAAYAAEGDRAGRAFAKSADDQFKRVVSDSFKIDEQIKKRLLKTDVDVDHHGRHWGVEIMRGVDAGLSLLPGRMEALFSGRGGPIGLAIGASLIAGVAAVLPALGAMVSGALFAGFGTAAVALGIALVAKDQRVTAAASRLKEMFTTEIFDGRGAEAFAKVTSAALDKVTVALKGWGPLLNAMLVGASRFVGPLAEGMIGFVNGFLGPMERMMNSPFMTRIMATLSAGLTTLGVAFGAVFDKFLADQQAMDGAVLGLKHLFDLMAATLTTIADILVFLSKTWMDWNTDPDGVGPMETKLQAIKSIFSDIWTIIKEISDEFQVAFGEGSHFEQTFHLIRNTKSDLEDIRVILAGLAGRQIMPDMNADAKGTGQGKSFWANQWDDFSAETEKLRLNIGQKFINLWTDIKNSSVGGWASIRTTLVEEMGIWKNIWSTSWGAVRDFFVAVWTSIANFFSGVWNSVFGFLAGSLAVLVTVWNSSWTTIFTILATIWGLMSVVVTTTFGGIANFIGSLLNVVASVWNSVWTMIFNIFSTIWRMMSDVVRSVFGSMASFISGTLDSIRGVWNTIWTSVHGILATIWQQMWGIVSSTFTMIKTIMEITLEAIRRKWDEIWTGMHKVLGDVWTGIVGAVKAGINSVIDILNMGKNAINAVLEKLGISFRIPDIPRLSGGGVVNGSGRRESFATGGKVLGPGTETSDSVPVLASRNEYIINAKSSNELGYRNLNFMNRTGRFPSFATGGRVGGGNNALLEAHRNHVHVAMGGPPMNWPGIVRKAAESGLPFNVSSTYRPGSRGSGGGLDHHSEGRAVDFGGYNQDAFASFWERTAGVIELIHRTTSRDYAIFGGRGGGISGFFNEWLAKGLGWVMDNMMNPAVNNLVKLLPGGVYGEMAKASIFKIRDYIKDKVNEAITAQAAMDAGNFSGSGLAGAQQWRATASQALSMLGLPQSWLGPLLTLIGRESGGNPLATNLSDSNAARGTPSIGLMQTIGPTFNAYKYPGYDNIRAPLDNILAGLRYIQARYGSIFNVQQAVGATPRGYDNGGWLEPGLYNGTSQPEPVFTAGQWDVLKGNMGEGEHYVSVYLGNELILDRVAATVDGNNHAIAQGFRRGRGV